MTEQRYSKWTVEGDKKTEWICGCFQTADDFFKFCSKHEGTLKKAIQIQVDELDMIEDLEGDNGHKRGHKDDRDRV